MTNGILITFEGGEGAGKTTQIKRVAGWLQHQGKKVLVTREPGGTLLADSIRKILLDPKHHQMTPIIELLLYEVARQDHVQKAIRPAIEKGLIVLCDRFTDATIAYQGYGRRLPLSLIYKWNAVATTGLIPNLTFLFDLPVTVGLKRTRHRDREQDRLDREKKTFHERVRRGYLTLARKERRFRIIDTRNPSDEVLKILIREIKKVI